MIVVMKKRKRGRYNKTSRTHRHGRDCRHLPFYFVMHSEAFRKMVYHFSPDFGGQKRQTA